MSKRNNVAKKEVKKPAAKGATRGRPRAALAHLRRQIITPEFLTPTQEELYNSVMDNAVTFVTGPAGTGKAQPLDAKILTPSGWKTMGEMKVGDEVVNQCGRAALVSGVYPQGLKEIYEVTFDDGAITKCCGEHLWLARTENERWTTKQFSVRSLDTINKNIGDRYHIPMMEAPDFNPPAGFVTGMYQAGKHIATKAMLNTAHTLITTIPSFIHFSLDSRLILFQGLMDHGSVVDQEVPSTIIFPTIHVSVAEDVRELAWSLGCKCYVEVLDSEILLKIKTPSNLIPYLRPKINTLAETYRPCANLFREIISIEFVGEQEAQCIMLGHPVDTHVMGTSETFSTMEESSNHLYITDDYIVTHNTYVAAMAALMAMKHPDKLISQAFITKPLVEAGEKIGFLPGDIEEKAGPYMCSFHHNFRKIIGKEMIDQLTDSQVVEILPLGYMRGLTLENSVAILDEAQNTTITQMKMFLSRLGRNSKLIIAGDTQQKDIGDCTSGLTDAVMKLKNIDSRIGVVEFGYDDIVRHPLVSKILSKYEEY
jgi:phosphate starvation-inducible protein PhoH